MVPELQQPCSSAEVHTDGCESYFNPPKWAENYNYNPFINSNNILSVFYQQIFLFKYLTRTDM